MNRLKGEICDVSSPRDAEARSFRQIIASSVVIGGSSLVNVGIGIVRTKVMALMLGPAGVGIAGLYGSIADVAVSVAGMGVNSSGVRQIADAAASDDLPRMGRTAAALSRSR